MNTRLKSSGSAHAQFKKQRNARPETNYQEPSALPFLPPTSSLCLEWERLKKPVGYGTRIALIEQQHQRKVKAKKQRSDPRHERRTWVRPLPPPCSWSLCCPRKKSTSEMARKMITKEVWARSSGSARARPSSRSNNEAAPSQLAMVSLLGAAWAYPLAHAHCRCSCPSRNRSPVRI